MVGLELTIKDEKISAAIEEGVLTIIVTQIRNESTDSIELDFAGLNSSPGGPHESLKWCNKKLKNGDELVIKIKDIHENSAPSVIVRDEKETEQKMLNSYYRLKKQLEDRGLI